MGVVWVQARRVGVPSNPNGKKSVLRTLAVVASTFVGFLGMIIILRLYNLISPQVALLMLIALLGLYFGVGVLVVAYRLVVRLEESPSQHRSRTKSPQPKDN